MKAIEYALERLGISWRRAVIPSAWSSDWTIVVDFRGFLKTFREHAEGLYLKELENVQENIDHMSMLCPFAGVSEELDKDEGYERNSELFEFMDRLLEEMLEVVDDLIAELKEHDLPDSGPWERKALAFYHGQVE